MEIPTLGPLQAYLPPVYPGPPPPTPAAPKLDCFEPLLPADVNGPPAADATAPDIRREGAESEVIHLILVLQSDAKLILAKSSLRVGK